MKKQLNRQQLILILLAICLVGGVGYGIYAYILEPKWSERDALKAENVQLVDEASNLRIQLQQDQKNAEASKRSDAELRMKVPKNRDISQLIRMLEQFEGQTATEVSSVAFNNYDASAKDTLQGDTSNEENTSDPNTPTKTTEEAEKQVEDEAKKEETDETKTETPTSDLANEEILGNMELITVSFTVSGEDIADVRQFLQNIERYPRLMKIDSVDYEIANPEAAVEQQTTDPATNPEDTPAEYPVQANVQITTFYAKDQE